MGCDGRSSRDSEIRWRVGHAPFSGRPNLGVTCSHSVRGILIDRAEVVAELHLLEQIPIPFLDGPPTKNRASVLHKNRVLREERGQGGGIVIVLCIAIFLNEREKPLA